MMQEEKINAIINTLRAEIKTMGFSRKDQLKIKIGMLGLSKWLRDIPDDQLGKLKEFLKEILTYSETGETGPILTPLFKDFDQPKKIEIEGAPFEMDKDTISKYLLDPQVIKILKKVYEVI